MKIGKIVRLDIANGIEGVLDKIQRLDPVKYYIKRAAAEAAADAIVAFFAKERAQ